MKMLNLSLDYFKSKFSVKELASSSFFTSSPHDLTLKISFFNDPFSFFDHDFIQKISALRQLYNKPIFVNCSFRSVAFDNSKGRSGNSYHCLGRAFDIKVSSDEERFKLVSLALKVGFNGIGIYSNFIHLDNRPAPVLWYGNY